MKRIETYFFLLLLFIASYRGYAIDDTAIPVLEKELVHASGKDRFYILLELSGLYVTVQESDSAVKYGTEALLMAQKFKDKEMEARALENLGDVYVARSDWSEALNYYTKSKDLLGEQQNDRLYIDVLIKLSEIYQRVDDYEKARKFLAEGLQHVSDSMNIARFHLPLGYVYYKLNNFEQALFYYHQAREYYFRHNFYYKTIDVIDKTGALYTDWGKYQEAISCYLEMLRMYTSLKDTGGIILSQYKLAHAYFQKGNDDTASFYIRQILSSPAARKHKLSEIIAKTYLLRGQIHKNQQQWQQAIDDFNTSIAMAGEIANIAVQVENFHNLYQVYEAMGNYRKALECYKTSQELQEFTSETSSLVSQVETKAAIQKNEQQIELQKRENELQNLRLSKQQNMLYLSVVGFILLLVIIGLIYRQSVVRKRTNLILRQQAEEIQIKNKQLEIKNMEIMDNIRYAQRIQASILPQHTYIARLLPDYFIFFRPRDILSGDFYWVQELQNSLRSKHEKEKNILVAAVDCTGHGVSGALLSIVGNNLLNQAVFEQHLSKPADILNFMHQQIFHIWKFTEVQTEIRVHDGMDMALINLDMKNRTLQYAGAKNPLCLVRNKEYRLFPATKQAIGERSDVKPHVDFENVEVSLLPGDCLYMYSDGYGDQFGGQENKKFKDVRMLKMFCEISHLPMKEQHAIVEKTFEEWKGENEQIDDVLIIGIKIP